MTQEEPEEKLPPNMIKIMEENERLRQENLRLMLDTQKHIKAALFMIEEYRGLSERYVQMLDAVSDLMDYKRERINRDMINQYR